jgi:acetyl esterase/lipase
MRPRLPALLLPALPQVFLLLACLLSADPAQAADPRPPIMTAEDLAAFPDPAADVRIPYGDGPLQFADLRLPKGPGPYPVMILIHGGCWLAEYDIHHIGKLAAAFTRSGIATWTVEYRRVGDEGGGWPGTFQDIAQAADRLLTVADEYSLDTTRVIAAGHSAGGQLALWLAARPHLPANTLFPSTQMVNVVGVLGLAPAPDLASLYTAEVCGDVVDKLMGGSPAAVPDRYALASPIELVPIGVPQLLVIGTYDDNWAPVGRRYFAAAEAAHDQVRLIEATQSGHFEMIDPDSITWPLVRDAAFELLGMPVASP